MKRRNAIIAAICGIIPALRLVAQDKLTGTVISTAPEPDPMYVAFMDDNRQVASFGWSRKTAELVVRMDGREKRLSAKEIMDALEGK